MKLKAVFALTRLKEYWDFNLVLCLLGFVIAAKSLSWIFLLIVAANLFGLAFAFMINDIEDAEEDATDPRKFLRNPIANKSISRKEGYLYTNIIFLASLLFYALMAIHNGTLLPLISGIIILLCDFLYSFRKIRLKKFPVSDLISHSYMLAGGQFLAAYFTLQTVLTLPALLAFLLVVFFSMYGELANEIRDYAIDVRTKIRTTAVLLGVKKSKMLQLVLVIAGAFCAIYLLSMLQVNLLIVVEAALIYWAFLGYPVIRQLLFKKQANLTADVHRAVLLATIVFLLIYIANFPA